VIKNRITIEGNYTTMDLLMEYVTHRRIQKQRRKEGKKEQIKKESKRKEEIN
jgi:hypothetical protein